ncbi:MAG: hypothetical protein KDD25_06810, partial [Bdellovibrionales bacterium]|nr:hypothetical protein [Bdellovibrionales bacterium]
MRYSTSLFILMLLISTTVGTFAHSEDKMDISTITTVIKKLKGALKLVDDKTVKHAVLAVRIADLYAERARLESMKAIEEDCSKCNKDFKDRSKALNYYEGAFEKLDSDTQNMVLFQMAHLYKLTNQTSRAEKLFNDVLKNQKAYPRELITEAQIGLGEIYYFKGDYKKSLVYFALAEKDRSTPKQGYIAFRLAWCHFNLGHDTLAKNYLIGILKSQEMLSRTLPNGDVVIDNSFHQDVAKDLTTFTARSSVRTSDINNIIDLSPDDRRRENLYFLGTETARLGKKQESLLVWDTFLASEHSTPSEKVDISLRLAQLTYDSGQFTNALSEYQDSLKLFQKHGCEDKSIGCDSIQARYRDFVTNWNKHEKAKPSINLLEAYIAYCETFPGDQQMLYWTAQVAQTNKKASTADKYYRLAAQAEDVKANIFNGSLLGAIETAESTNNPEKKLAAYNLYLKENPKGDKVLEVRYQRAHTYYELKDYKKASSEFTSIAREYKSSKSPLPLNSADLALDTLVILKDHEEVRDLAVEFASLYPQRKNEFHTISSVAITNIAGLVNDDKSSSQSEMRSALNSLQKI